ncbi:ProQ/FINO family protein [Zooshikella harenae]|uniref:ProQ/FinO domain-containing protein n=1 Tax=Zooshikella harenae TaxID=2827238 RepID=A0ABS5ZL26_9GAMM|nr:ProQ/FINO family protein [Zooshikella harenae]MBU2714046.1 hypothetical protein [Zooshikella harenae]
MNRCKSPYFRTMKNTEKSQPHVVVKEKRTQLSLTSVKNHQPKMPSSQRPLHEIFAVLEAAFPKVLGKTFHPLKIGIHKDLAQSVVREQLNHRECRRGLYA